MQRFHIGTNLALATIFLLDQEELAPGQGGFAQLRLEQPVVAMPKDRFVIRGSSAIQTIGGGVVLDTHPGKHKRFSPSVLEDLTVLRDGSEEEILRQHILRSGSGGMTRDDLLNRVAMAPDEMEVLLKKMTEKGDLLVVDPEKLKVIANSQYQRLKELSLDQLKEFHQRFPMKSGLSKEELRTRLPGDVDIKLFQILVHGLLKTNGVLLEKDKLRMSEHQVFSLDEKGLIKKVEEAMMGGGLQPPSPKELAEKWNEKEEEVLSISEHLVHEGVLVKVKNGIYFHRTHFEKLKEELVTFLRRDKEITTPQFKELTGVSRKYAIPLIEYFDQMKVTLRLGEKRILRAGKESA
jgi:selenocysteine-specific elongation factor